MTPEVDAEAIAVEQSLKRWEERLGKVGAGVAALVKEIARNAEMASWRRPHSLTVEARAVRCADALTCASDPK